MTAITPDSTKPTRHWLRFSLRTLFVVSLVIGFGCAWVGMQLEQKRQHEAVVKEISKLGGGAIFSDAGEIPAWKEWLFGSYAVRPVTLFLHNTEGTDSFLARTQSMNLISIDLSSSKVTDSGLTHLTGLAGLEWIELGNTEVTDTGLAHLKGLNSLYRLILDSTPITDAGLTHLKGMPALRWLDLSNTPLTDAGLAHLAGLPRLEYLNLENTHMTDAGLAHLAGLTNLESLSLENTQVTQAGVDRLRKAIPNCEIYSSL